MKFLHAADVHLDSPLRGLERYEGAPVDEIRGATRNAFDNLIELAIEEKVDFLLIAGDLYDGDWKDYNTGLYFVDRMRRLESEDIPVFIVAGNHDAASQITKQLRLPGNVCLFSTNKPQTVVLEDLGVAVHGQGFAKREVTEDLTVAYPQADTHLFNVGVLHTCLDGKPGHERYAPCTVEGLRSKGYQYWALGHIHNREAVCQDPWIVFPGNIQGRHVRETGPKGCTLVIVDNGEVASVEHRDLDVLRWTVCKVDVKGLENVDDVYEQVRSALSQELDDADGRMVAARLVLYGSSSLHSQLHVDSDHWVQEYRALAASFRGAGMWLEKVIFDTQQAVSLDEVLNREDALGGLLRAIHAMDFDSAGITELGDELAALRKKLPPELLNGEERFDPTDSKYLTGLIGDIKELLMHRLLITGDE